MVLAEEPRSNKNEKADTNKMKKMTMMVNLTTTILWSKCLEICKTNTTWVRAKKMSVASRLRHKKRQSNWRKTEKLQCSIRTSSGNWGSICPSMTSWRITNECVFLRVILKQINIIIFKA